MHEENKGVTRTCHCSSMLLISNMRDEQDNILDAQDIYAHCLHVITLA